MISIPASPAPDEHQPHARDLGRREFRPELRRHPRDDENKEGAGKVDSPVWIGDMPRTVCR